MKTQKKGIELNQAMGAVLTIILVALLVIVSIYIFSSLNSATVTPLTAGTSVNESLGRATATGITLSARDNTLACGALTKIMNTTGNYPIGLGNVTQTGCLVTNKSTSTEWADLGSTWKYSYPYTYSAETAASNASTSMNVSFGTYPALVGLVGTIVFLALVIGVLVASFVFGGRKGV